jgi:hypothetical protein
MQRMEGNLLNLLRGQSAESILKVVHDLAEKQRLEAQKALKLFALTPVPVLVGSKEEFRNLSKEEQRQWQKQKEEERRQLNKEAGIDGRALLTKENVLKWREEGLTYGAIARDIVGCPDWEVSAVGKEKMPWINKKRY